MTENRNFKRLVRARMASTGERYAAARAHLLDAEADLSPHPLFAGVTAIGGTQPDLAAAANLCANAGVRGHDGLPLSEAMAFGLAGGVGFLYGVFVYADGPTMTIVGRNNSMPDPFCEPLFARAGAQAEITTTGGATKAATQLDRVLEADQPALCTVGAGALPYLGESAAMASMAPHLVGVVGRRSDGTVLLDDRAPGPIAVERDDLDRARGAYAKAKHRMITIESIDDSHDWAAAVADAAIAGAVGFDTPPVPQFAANVGLNGLEKFQRLLTATGDAKGWPRVFAEGPTAALGLSRLHDCIEVAYTSPAAGRPLQAEFLDQAAPLTGNDRFAEAAGRFRASGSQWAAIVAVIADTHPTLARYVTLSEERASQLDGNPDPETMARLGAEQQSAVAGCDLSADAATEAYRAIAAALDGIVANERAAIALVLDRSAA